MSGAARGLARLGLGLALLSWGPARAAPEPAGEADATAAQAAFSRARAAEAAGRPEEEAAACAEVVAQRGGGRPQAACEARLATLAALADPGGGWAGLAALEAARRGPASEREARLVQVAEDAAVAPAVRALAATALAGRALDAGEGQAALRWTSAWWPGPELPADVRGRLGRAHARALVAVGRGEEAAAVEAALALPTRGGVEDLRRQARREALARGAGVVLGAWALVAAPLAARGWARRPRPRPVGLLALAGVGLGGLLLAGAWEPAVARPFALLLLALAATHLVATGAALALVERPLAGRLLGLGSALAALATGVLGLHLGGLWGWVGG